MVGKSGLPVLLGRTFIGRALRSIHPAERKLVPYQSPKVPILMVLEGRSVAEKGEYSYIRRSILEDLELLVTPTQSEPRSIKVAEQIVLKVITETSVLVSKRVADLVEVITTFNIVAKNRACMTAMGIIDVY